MRTFVWILKRDRILSIFMGATLLRNAQIVLKANGNAIIALWPACASQSPLVD
jgi:hypothetical protein